MVILEIINIKISEQLMSFFTAFTHLHCTEVLTDTSKRNFSKPK